VHQTTDRKYTASTTTCDIDQRHARTHTQNYISVPPTNRYHLHTVQYTTVKHIFQKTPACRIRLTLIV